MKRWYRVVLRKLLVGRRQRAHPNIKFDVHRPLGLLSKFSGNLILSRIAVFGIRDTFDYDECITICRVGEHVLNGPAEGLIQGHKLRRVVPFVGCCDYRWHSHQHSELLDREQYSKALTCAGSGEEPYVEDIVVTKELSASLANIYLAFHNPMNQHASILKALLVTLILASLFAHVRSPCVTDMGIVCPDDNLRIGAFTTRLTCTSQVMRNLYKHTSEVIIPVQLNIDDFDWS